MIWKMLFYFNLFASTIIFHVVGSGLPSLAPNDHVRKRKSYGAEYQTGLKDNFKMTMFKKSIRLKSNDEVIFDLVKVKENMIDSNSVHKIEKSELEKKKSEEVLESYYFLAPGYDQLVAINRLDESTRRQKRARDYKGKVKYLRYNGEGSGEDGSGEDGSGDDGSASEEYTDDKNQGNEAGKENSLLEKFKKDWLTIKTKLKPTMGYWNWLGSGFYTMMNELGVFARKVSPVKLPCVMFC